MTVIANRSICAPTPNLSIYKVLAPFCKIFLYRRLKQHVLFLRCTVTLKTWRQEKTGTIYRYTLSSYNA